LYTTLLKKSLIYKSGLGCPLFTGVGSCAPRCSEPQHFYYRRHPWNRGLDKFYKSDIIIHIYINIYIKKLIFKDKLLIRAFLKKALL